MSLNRRQFVASSVALATTASASRLAYTATDKELDVIDSIRVPVVVADAPRPTDQLFTHTVLPN